MNECKMCKHRGQQCQNNRKEWEKSVPQEVVNITECENFTPTPINCIPGNPKTINEIGRLGLEFAMQAIQFDIANLTIIHKELLIALKGPWILESTENNPNVLMQFNRERTALMKFLVQNQADIKERKEQESFALKELSK